MTLNEIKTWVTAIDAVSDDAEKAHGEEDELYKELLEFFSLNAPSPFQELASEALKTKELQFPRWCA